MGQGEVESRVGCWICKPNVGDICRNKLLNAGAIYPNTRGLTCKFSKDWRYRDKEYLSEFLEAWQYHQQRYSSRILVHWPNHGGGIANRYQAVHEHTTSPHTAATFKNETENRNRRVRLRQSLHS
ncbi:hypothetical protein M758_8G076800 [Ceratodon purpureus]|nr:hypothetical protein M758_8G076800 [Ceratodon purpureus]